MRFDIAGKAGSEQDAETLLELRKVQAVSKLHHILRPFLLRRLKVDVEKSLPKKEMILYTPMTKTQQDYNDHLVKKTLAENFDEKGNTPVMFCSLNFFSFYSDMGTHHGTFQTPNKIALEA